MRDSDHLGSTLAGAASSVTPERKPDPLGESIRAWNEAYPRMNIHCAPGTVVIFDARGGWPYEQESSAKQLTVRTLYEVESTDIRSSRTLVKLRGIDGTFNSCLFSEAPIASASLSTIKEMREALSHLYAASNGNSDDEISARLRARSVLTKYPETNK